MCVCVCVKALKCALEWAIDGVIANGLLPWWEEEVDEEEKDEEEEEEQEKEKEEEGEE